MENMEKIKQDVENTNDSYRKIALRYGTNHTQIRKNVEKYGWNISHRKVRKVSKIPKKKDHLKILGSVALRKIDELKKELGDKYSNIDEPLIVMYSKNYERYLELEIDLLRDGAIAVSPKTGAEYMSPTFTASLAVQKNLVTIANQLGLSIASRKRLNISFEKEDTRQTIFDFTTEINEDFNIKEI